jgi:tight adherence protein B
VTDEARGLLVLLVGFGIALGGLALWLAGSVQRSRLVERYQPARARSPAEVLAALDAQLLRLSSARTLRARLRASGVPDSVTIATAIGAVAVVLGGLAGAWIVDTTTGALVGMLVAGACLWVWLRQARRRWRERLEDQLPDLARLLGAATAAGIATARAIERAAGEVADPMASELRRVVAETRLGHPLDKALDGMAKRLDLSDLRMLVGTIVIQHTSGGDVAGALRELAGTLDERNEVRREIRTQVASARVGVPMVVGLTGIILVTLNSANPGTLNRLTTSPLGLLAVAVSAGLFALAAYMVNRMLRIDV